MVHMTCKRTTNAKEDLAYVVNKFLRAEPLDPLAIRSSIHSHTQTVSPDKRHIQVCFSCTSYIFMVRVRYFINIYSRVSYFLDITNFKLIY